MTGWVAAGERGPPDDREDRLLPWPSVQDIAGISRTTAWRLQRTGEFPQSVPISANRVCWWESELTAWKARRRQSPLPRPKPYAATIRARERPKAPAAAENDAAGPRPVDTAQRQSQPAPRPATKRRGRPRVVSPDQIDFGF
ncbi:MAG: AlpA family phage regulatory protein [Brevundimonas sp.]|nr:MAG: AlpA family phage regulatory protein [Brevundimonas sp.]